MFAEIIHRSCFDAVSSLPKVNLVQIHGKNFIFSIFIFQFFGDKSFFNLTGYSTFLSKESILCELLGNGTASLYFAAAKSGEEGTQRTAIINAAMLIKAVILNSDKSQLSMLGNFIKRYGNTAFF